MQSVYRNSIYFIDIRMDSIDVYNHLAYVRIIFITVLCIEFKSNNFYQDKYRTDLNADLNADF